jgi:hypothetical protein
MERRSPEAFTDTIVDPSLPPPKKPTTKGK